MATMHRIRVPWSGGVGGNGLSTFYFTDATVALAPLHAFFDAVKSYVATGISWQFPGEGDTMESTTGELTGTWSATGQAAVVASGGGSYSAPVGAMVSWLTGAVYFGHRIKGRTYIVPTNSATDSATGGLAATPKGAIQTAARALIAAAPGNLLIWSRPVLAAPSWTDVKGRTHPAKDAHAGYAVGVVDATVPDKMVVLRSRRD